MGRTIAVAVVVTLAGVTLASCAKRLRAERPDQPLAHLRAIIPAPFAVEAAPGDSFALSEATAVHGCLVLP